MKATRSRVFDGLSRVTKEIGALGQSYNFAYDANNNLTSLQDPRGNTTTASYDPVDRLAQALEPDSAQTSVGYDAKGRVASITDPRGLATTYVNNALDEVVQETSPDRGAISYSYDTRGLLSQRTDALGNLTSFLRDDAGRLTGKWYSANQGIYYKTFYWDRTDSGSLGIGRLAGGYNESGGNWRVYDANGRVSWEGRVNNPAPWLITQYAYDGSGNVTEMLYPSGRRVSYMRDAARRIIDVSSKQTDTAPAQTVISGVQWNPFGPIASMNFGYGATAIFTRDTDYRITRLQVGYSGSPGGVLDRSYAWTGDMVDSIIDNRFPGTTPPFTFSAQSQLFTYTPSNRLATAVGYYGSLAWTYDANGNRASETANGVVSSYAYPSTSNRLLSITPAGQTARTFSYDAAGDIVTDTRSGALGMSFQYDVEGRLSQAYKTNAPADVSTYGYDALDRLASRKVTSGGITTTTLYIHDIKNYIIAETDTTGATLREYIWIDDLPVAVVDRVNTGSPVLYYVHTDHLGRPALISSQNWEPIWYAIYSPFGAASYVSNAAGFGGQDIHFPGQWFQLETGLAYNWHRHYDASIGRYLQPDPIGLEGGRILYGYADANPLAKIDPDGRFVQTLLPFIIPALPSLGPLIPYIPYAGSAAGAAAAGWMWWNSPADNEPKGEPKPSGDGRICPPKGGPPRDKHGNYAPDPEAEGPHTTIGTRQSEQGDYTQGATFDGEGNFIGRTDVTDHGRPWDHENPHFHPATRPGSTGRGIGIR